MAIAITTDLGVDALPGGVFTFSPKTEAITLDLFQPQIKSLKQSGQINSEKQENQIKWVQ